MGNKVFVCTVLVLWLGSMAWLVTDRILPSFYEGQPPMVQAFQEGKAVAWAVLWKDQQVGESASVRLAGAGGSTNLFNRVVLTEFPVMELAPAWIRSAIGNLGHMNFDALTRMEFDPLGSFSAFNSRIALNDMPSVLSMSGRIEESNLELDMRSDNFSHVTSIYLPNSEVLSEALFPDAKLPYLYLGRSWQEKVYSPFSSPTTPVERVQAEVIEIETIEHLGEIRRVMRVDYKSIDGTGIPDQARTQGISWVDPVTGEVLRRDVFFGKSRLRFERLSKEAGEAAGRKLFEDQLSTVGLSAARPGVGDSDEKVATPDLRGRQMLPGLSP